ncbi:MAG: SusD/RagB family nutrient-binding outer membrane lipoprotein [Gemmatimonadetes bacterium]|nr:SusD/RagB family nutrient-binding outer membrane lipoprotein [Gemmatimonadota bacterium]
MSPRSGKLVSGGLTSALLLAAFGCTSDFTGINQNPNAPTDAPSEFLLVTAIQTGTQQTMGSLGRGVIGHFIQHTSAIEYAWDDRYDVRAETYNGAWNGIYSGPLQDVEAIIKKETAAGRPNRLAVAMILKAWLFHHITDLWGDVPYTEALKGAENVRPAYDAQRSIYQSLVTLLQDARAQIQPTGLTFGTNDIIYGGNMTRWRMFAASLQFRLGMRLSEADPVLAQAIISNALAAGVFASRADEALMRWLEDNSNANPWWSGATEAAGGSRVAATIVDTLKSLSDPRLPIYARSNQNGQYIGMQNGLRDGHGIPFNDRSRIGTWFLRTRSSPSVILSYAEVLFLRAEAALRGWASGDPAAFYTQGITEAMRFYGIPDAAITAYLAQPAVAYDPARGLQQIGLQSWIALFGNSLEAWSTWRRTGIPALAAGPDNVTAGQLPRRMLYPTDEQSLNDANLQAALSRQGGGTAIWDRVWFDKRP